MEIQGSSRSQLDEGITALRSIEKLAWLQILMRDDSSLLYTASRLGNDGCGQERRLAVREGGERPRLNNKAKHGAHGQKIQGIRIISSFSLRV